MARPQRSPQSNRKPSPSRANTKEDFFRVLVEQTPDAILTLDETASITYANPGTKRLLGHTTTELVGRSVIEFLHPEDVGQAEEMIQQLLLHPELPVTVEMRTRDGSGAYHDVQAVGVNRLENAAIRAIVINYHDLAERRRAEGKWRGLLESAPDAIVVVDGDGRIVLVNGQAGRMFGYPVDELLGQPIEVLMPERFHSVHQSHRRGYFQDSQPRPMGMGLVLFGRRKDRTEFPAEISLSPLKTEQGLQVSAAIRDVTDRMALEEKYRQAQKMEAVGRLAGGIAHDFNNILTTILGSASMLLQSVSSDDPRRQDVEDITYAGERAAVLTQQVLAFSRRQVLQPVPLDLNRVVSRMDNMLRRLLGEDIEFHTRLARDLGPVEADPGQLEQIIVNLAINARDAMAEGGRLTIETENVELDETKARALIALSPGSYVTMILSDTGTGMDAETRSHIFEPFFTTKGPEKGTGLGLATVYGIVKQSGGHISCHSELGKGTSFKVYLPRVEGQITQIEPVPETVMGLGGSETVLVADDDEDVRNVVRRALDASGYHVLVAADGDEALRVAAEYQDRIHLLLTDIVMPKMRGPELKQRLSEQRPDVRVLYVSGYARDALLQHGMLATGIAFLQKPFTAITLVRRVREVLDAAR